jgi:tRNA threonylcarbamoyladenosine biosynthesis protein TsaB
MAERAARHVLVLIDSRRGDVFAQLFTPDLDPVGPASALSLTEIVDSLPRDPVILTGDGVAMVRSRLDAAAIGTATMIASNCGPPDARHLARLAGRTDRSSYMWPPVPVYLRDPAVSSTGAIDRGPDSH